MPIETCTIGAPGEIRTPDPQIRSLVLYPAELRARRVVAIGSAAQWQEGAMARRGLPAARLCRAAPATPAEWFSSHGFLTMRAGAAMGGKLDGAIGNRQPQGRTDRALDQANFAAMGAHQFGGDRKAKSGAAGASRTLESFKQMRARVVGKTGAGVGNLDEHHRAFTAAGDANLIPAGIAIGAAFGGLAFHRLHRVA